MTHPIEFASSRVIGDLRLDHEQQYEDGTLRLTDGAYFSWEATKGKVHLDVVPELGALMHLSAKIEQAPDWLTFNIDLGEDTLVAGDVLGVVIEYQGFAGDDMELFLRSSRGGVLGDTILRDRLPGSETRTTQVLLHTLQPYDPATGETGYHTLIFPLPKRDFTFELRDLRLFVVPAARKLDFAPLAQSKA